jgi:hypothetical protein
LRRGGAAIEHRQNQGVLQAGSGLDLPEEPFGAEDVRQLGPEDLDGHLAVVPEITRQVDDRHATSAELAFYPVSTGEGFGDVGLLV